MRSGGCDRHEPVEGLRELKTRACEDDPRRDRASGHRGADLDLPLPKLVAEAPVRPDAVEDRSTAGVSCSVAGSSSISSSSMPTVKPERESKSAVRTRPRRRTYRPCRRLLGGRRSRSRSSVRRSSMTQASALSGRALICTAPRAPAGSRPSPSAGIVSRRVLINLATPCRSRSATSDTRPRRARRDAQCPHAADDRSPGRLVRPRAERRGCVTGIADEACLSLPPVLEESVTAGFNKGLISSSSCSCSIARRSFSAPVTPELRRLSGTPARSTSFRCQRRRPMPRNETARTTTTLQRPRARSIPRFPTARLLLGSTRCVPGTRAGETRRFSRLMSARAQKARVRLEGLTVDSDQIKAGRRKSRARPSRSRAAKDEARTYGKTSRTR